MKLFWKAGIAAALGLCVASDAAWAASSSQTLTEEEKAVRDALAGAQETCMQSDIMNRKMARQIL